MDDPSRPHVTDEELHALLDGQLDPAQAEALQARLARDPAAHERFQTWQRQRAALQRLHADLLHEPVPAGLQAAATRLARIHRRQRQAWQLGGLAAGLLLSFGLGWFMHGQFATAPALQAQVQPARAFILQASAAHAVYAPEARHPVEVAAAQQEHLVQWLSKRLGRPLKAPQLGELGFELVGGRLLPAEDGARAQFMYQNAQGERITLYLGSTPAAVQASAGRTEFRYSSDGPVPVFYWVDQGYGYALSGALSRAQLLQLAQAVHRQL